MILPSYQHNQMRTTKSEYMSIHMSEKLDSISSPATHEISAKAKAMQQEGVDVISLSIGEPDFNTPDYIKQAAKQALDDNHTHYTPIAGIPQLKTAICNKLERENSLKYKESQVIVCNGVKQAIYNLAAALLSPGDEVIIPAPYWVSYPDIIRICGATPVFATADITQNFKVTAKQIQSVITERSKLIILNSPNNPSGMIYHDDEWQAIAELLLANPHICIASDDIYEHIRWTDNPYHNILNVCPELYERTVILNGLSKSFAMTGWRLGYAAGPEHVIKGMLKVQSQSTSGVNSITQYAACAALERDLSAVHGMRDAYHARYRLAFTALANMNLIQCTASEGAFYILADVSAAMQHHKCKSDVELVELLLTQAHVATVPGSAFGMPNTIRFSIATPEHILEKALLRLNPFLHSN